MDNFEKFYDKDGNLDKVRLNFGRKKRAEMSLHNNYAYLHLTDYSKCWKGNHYDPTKKKSFSMGLDEYKTLQELKEAFAAFEDEMFSGPPIVEKRKSNVGTKRSAESPPYVQVYNTSESKQAKLSAMPAENPNKVAPLKAIDSNLPMVSNVEFAKENYAPQFVYGYPLEQTATQISSQPSMHDMQHLQPHHQQQQHYANAAFWDPTLSMYL